MSIENFMNFGAAISFFMGMFFSFLKFTSLSEILLATVIFGSCLFLIIATASILILRFFDKDKEVYIEKNIYESVLEEYKIKINKRHTEFIGTMDEIHTLDVKPILSEPFNDDENSREDEFEF